MLEEFNAIWVLDSEFHQQEGFCPTAICAVGRELKSGEIRVWLPDKGLPPPYTAGPKDLIVAYAAQAEGQVILSENWPDPVHWIDLLPVVRRLNNFHGRPLKISLLEALRIYNIPSINADAKDFYRDIAIRGGPFTTEEVDGLVEYCKSDVHATAALFRKLLPKLELRFDLLSGRYTGRAVAKMEYNGVPIDVTLYEALQLNWNKIRQAVREKANHIYAVFTDGGMFSQKLFGAYLARERLKWPRLTSGHFDLKDETFKEMVQLYPKLALLHETRKLLSGLRSLNLAIGPDGRNRTGLWPYSSRTGRNQPKTSKWIFGPSSWMRSLILPESGNRLLSLDYCQQEFIIAAALSKDESMMACYQSGDPYLHFAILAGAIPPDATKASHPFERGLYKTTVLALLYGIGPAGLARKLGDLTLAKRLISDFNRVFPTFRIWCSRTVDMVTLHRRSLRTPLRWAIHCHPEGELNTRSITNWPVQSVGSEILRIAAISMVEHCLPVCAPIHDAFLLVCPSEQAPAMTELATKIMEDASAGVLNGSVCRVEASLLPEGSRYYDEKGAAMFEFVTQALERILNSNTL